MIQPQGLAGNVDKLSRASTHYYLNFSFFKIDPKWRWLNEVAKKEAINEFGNAIEYFRDRQKGMLVRTYSTIGLREDADFMLWTISDDVEKMQGMAAKIYSTVLGKYMAPSYTYLSATRPSMYSSKVVPGFMTDQPPMKYVIVYPFVKSREWYLLPFEERKRMMEEHIIVGRKFPQVRLNTTYSFGLDDQDFMLAFETEDLAAFQELIMQLRETQVSRYVVRDTPMIVCIHKAIEQALSDFG
ncbi:MAG: chlorite dismutase family protein [Thermoproteota archaeon]